MARLSTAAFAFTCCLGGVAPSAVAQTDLVAFANEACITSDAGLAALIATAHARGWRGLTHHEISESVDPSFDGMNTMTGWRAGSGDAAVTLIFGEYLHESDAMRAHAASGAAVVQLDEEALAFAQAVPRMASGTVCAVSMRSENVDADVAALAALRVDGAPLGDPYLDGNDPLSEEDARFWGRQGFRAVVWQQRQEPSTVTYIGSARGGLIRVYNSGRR